MVLRWLKGGAVLVGLVMAVGCKPEAEPLPPPIQGSANPQIWYAPNVGAPDTLRMFTEPDLWAGARSRIQVFQMYIQNIGHDYWGPLPGCPTCGDSVYPKLVAADVFRKLQDWGIQLALEGGAVKPGSPFVCNGSAYAEANREIFRRISNAGGRPATLIMDQPLDGGDACPQPIETTVESTLRFIRLTQMYFRQFYPSGPELTIGLTEPYPGQPIARLQQFIQALLDEGYQLPYFHLDVDRNHVKDKKLSEAAFARDLHNMYEFCRARGIDFGLIYTGFDDKTDVAYRRTVLEWVDRSRRVLGVPEHVKFQSWAFVSKNPDGTENWSVPLNLPEANPSSHTGLLMEGLGRLGL